MGFVKFGNSVYNLVWRTLKKHGELNAKFPGGKEAHKKKVESEGHTVYARGKRLFVNNWEEEGRT